MPLGHVSPDLPLVMDTNILTYWQENKVNISNRIAAYIIRNSKPPFLTSISVFESIRGFESKKARNSLSDELKNAYEKTKNLISQCDVLELNQEAAELAAIISSKGGGSETIDKRNDIYIAAIAIVNNYGIATANRIDFEDIAAKLPTDRYLFLEIWKPGDPYQPMV